MKMVNGDLHIKGDFQSTIVVKNFKEGDLGIKWGDAPSSRIAAFGLFDEGSSVYERSALTMVQSTDTDYSRLWSKQHMDHLSQKPLTGYWDKNNARKMVNIHYPQNLQASSATLQPVLNDRESASVRSQLQHLVTAMAGFTSGNHGESSFISGEMLLTAQQPTVTAYWGS